MTSRSRGSQLRITIFRRGGAPTQASMPIRHGGLRRSASSQSQAADAWSRRSARPQSARSTKSLATHGRTIHSGHSRTAAHVSDTTTSPPDMTGSPRDVAEGPIASCSAQNAIATQEIFRGRSLRSTRYFACAAIAFSICSLTASRLKLAPFCMGGNSIAVWPSFATSCCTNTPRQNWYANQL